MMKKKVYLLGALLLAITTLYSQNISGTWTGKLSLPNETKLNIVFHIKATEEGYTATIDSPDQGAENIATDSVALTNNELFIKIGKLMMTYKGKLENDTTINGSMIGMFPMKLNLIKKELKLNRPQEPLPPYPYITEDVLFENKDAQIKLSGTLTYPKVGNKFPAIVLITGSGPQNRDEEIFGHKPFLVIADYLTRNGIAVLRYDDRGTARSEGNFKSATTKDFASDALFAFKYLKTRKEIDSQKIGLLGHSEGGIIVFMLAAENNDIAYIISLAGIAYKGEDALAEQRKMIFQASNTSSAEYEQNEVLYKKMNKMIEGKTLEEVKQNAIIYVDSLFPSGVFPAQKELIAKQIVVEASPWMRFLLQYDPGKDITKIKCPILAVNGLKDLQVNADTNLDKIKELSPKATIKKYPDLNHLFQHSRTGLLIEYGKIEETISPEVLQDITNWTKEITK